MSTNYYKLKVPITSIRILLEGSHEKITIWTNHSNAGTLCLNKGDGNKILRMFIYEEDDSKCPMRTHWGGNEIGTIVTENQNNLLDDQQLISEYGEILTVKEIRERKGAKRKDGMPTELFGFEKIEV